MERLTRAEETVMHALWKLGPSFVKDLVKAMPRPRPAVTTVSTIVRILEEKGFVGHEAFGRSHRYHALVSREAYGKRAARRLLHDYFAGSPHALLSSFMEREDIGAEELDALLRLIKKHRKP
ncbi:MAG: BlaI/MecI/CopY family transcriptional regulator [Flavobacteriales bacterium]|jgi:predicted transcriptional regulator|nr:MAG: BlaI/MecI/CopY family transcriptional regulator [Flavobacteriales bacterium]